MARKTTARKPAPRRRAPAKGKTNRSFVPLGWLAAAALGMGWMISDGRPLAYAASWLPQATSGTRIAERSARPAIQRAEPRKEVARASPAATPVKRPVETDRVHTASLQPVVATPRPAPRLAPMKMPRDPASSLVRAEGASAPLSLAALASTEPPVRPVAQAAAPTGSRHHATRKLEMHAAPDAAARVIANIESATEVMVLRAEGPWRYVSSAGGRRKGWVDGTYLAGEAGAPSAIAVARAPASSRNREAAVLPAFSPTDDRQLAAARASGPRTRLPPAAISTE
ncbi:hypothetical protein [Aureimonas sp. SA4125]|uniref:hypothetical protein n=1 Tax=Aureimonas sp. SA4125 TaxID=2826993 RepID=UPI001CC7767F|nr:hypothetical protein [Aureimonas sp. SA4125]